MNIKSKEFYLCDISGEVISTKDKITFKYDGGLIHTHKQYFPREAVDPKSKKFNLEALTVLFKNNTLVLREFVEEYTKEDVNYYIDKETGFVETLINFAKSNTNIKFDVVNKAVDYILKSTTFFDEKLCPILLDKDLHLTNVYNIPITSEDLPVMQILKDNLKSLAYIKDFDSSVLETSETRLSSSIIMNYILESAWNQFMIKAADHTNIYDFLDTYIEEENKQYDLNKSHADEKFYVPKMEFDPYKMTLLESNKHSYKGFTYIDTISNRFVYCVSNDNGSYMDKIRGIKKYVIINYSLKEFTTQFNIFQYFKQYLMEFVRQNYSDISEIVNSIKSFGINMDTVEIPINKSKTGVISLTITMQGEEYAANVTLLINSKTVREIIYDLNSYEGWISFICSVKALIEDDTMLKNFISMIEKPDILL